MNTRQHRFVLNLFQGMNQTDAYIQARNGDSRDLPGTNAATLIANPSIAKELNRLNAKREAVVTANEINNCLSRDEKRSLLAEIARARLIDFSKDGEPALTEDTPNNRAAREFYHRKRFDKDGNPIITKSIKLTSAIEAIAEDNKMEGHYAPSKHMVAQSVQINVVHQKKLRNGEDTVQTKDKRILESPLNADKSP